MFQVQVEFETDVFTALGKSPQEVAEEMRVGIAVLWYAKGLVSQGKAAEIAGLSRAGFLDALAANGVPACQETIEEIREFLMDE